MLSTRCVDTGPDGDANPSMVIADVGNAKASSPMHSVPKTLESAVYKDLSRQDIQKIESSKPDFIVDFTEDKSAFYYQRTQVLDARRSHAARA